MRSPARRLRRRQGRPHERLDGRMVSPMKVLCIASILTLVLLPCGCGTRDPSKAATSKQENANTVAEVNALHGDFIAALKRRYWSEDDGFETCVLHPEPTLYSDDVELKEPVRWRGSKSELPALRRDTYDSFWSQNERARPIAPLDRGAMKLKVLTKAEVAEFRALWEADTETDYWGTFRARYGNAVRVRLSAPGFSGDRQQAVIYYEASFDYLAAWGSYCLLKREGDRWEIVEEYGVWVS